MTQIGSVYGQALYDLALSEGLAEELLSQLTVLLQGIQAEPDFIRLLSTPTLTKQQRCQILDDSFSGKLHLYIMNFLKLLTEKGYIRHFSDCCAAYQECYDRDNGILPVTAVTAIPLSQPQITRLQEKLAAITGKTIRLESRVDPECIGGVRLDYDGKRLDDTISHRLESVSKLLKNTVL